MNAYCEKQGRSLNTTRFIYDGNRLDPKKTPMDVSIIYRVMMVSFPIPLPPSCFTVFLSRSNRV
jgi:hypothetical protein